MAGERVGTVVECEICGKAGPMSRVTVDGVMMNVCASCGKFGTPVATPARPVSIALGRTTSKGGPAALTPDSRWGKDIYQEITDDLVTDYPQRIRQAREKRGWTREELGKRLNEKVSIVEKLESGTFRPDDGMARKITKVLEIRMMETVADTGPRGAGRKKAATLGDIAIIKKKR